MSLIDDYLETTEPSKRKQLQRIRMLAKEIVPSAEETISYDMPTLKYEGKAFLGFDAHADHIGIYPYSGRVIPQLKDELRAYTVSKGAIRVPLDRPISKRLLKLVIACRLEAIRAENGGKRGRAQPAGKRVNKRKTLAPSGRAAQSGGSNATSGQLRRPYPTRLP